MEYDNDWLEKQQLHFAAMDGDLPKVKELITSGYSINVFDEIGKTPLHYAVKNNHMEVADFLIKSGADVNIHDESQIGNTPLAEVAENCSLATAQLLINAGADPTIRGWMQLNALDRAKDRKRGDGPAVYQLLVETAKKLKK